MAVYSLDLPPRGWDNNIHEGLCYMSKKSAESADFLYNGSYSTFLAGTQARNAALAVVKRLPRYQCVGWRF